MTETVILLRRAHTEIKPEHNVILGEPVFDVINQCLLVGDGTGGAQKVAEIIVGPHDDKAYAKLSNHEPLIPIAFYDVRYNRAKG